MEYLGGTYIAQVESNNEYNAIKPWLKNLAVDEIKYFTENDRANLLALDFKDDAPNLLLGCKNVWCFSLNTRKGYALINIIKTRR